MSYTASKAQTGLQTQFNIKYPTSGSFIPIYEVNDFSQSGKTNKTADVTNLNSTGEEFLAVILSPGTYDLTYNRVASDPGQSAVLSAFNAKATVPFTIQLPIAPGQTTTGDLYAFNGLVEELDDISSISPTKQIMTKAKIKVSGGITLTPGS